MSPLHVERLAGSVLEGSAPGQPWVVAHSRAVAAVARAFAGGLRRADLPVEAVGAAALLHDVGKGDIPPAVLCKPDVLAPDEWRLMRAHAARGAEIVAGMEAVAHLAPVVRAVHERWDGRGYPDGLAGEAIPPAARLIAVCDAYVAMTEHRPYGGVLSHVEALEELVGGAGTQFDPALVHAFVAHLALTRR
jgi:putative nucleotidyltransferase with HDIG domain